MKRKISKWSFYFFNFKHMIKHYSAFWINKLKNFIFSFSFLIISFSFTIKNAKPKSTHSHLTKEGFKWKVSQRFRKCLEEIKQKLDFLLTNDGGKWNLIWIFIWSSLVNEEQVFSHCVSDGALIFLLRMEGMLAFRNREDEFFLHIFHLLFGIRFFVFFCDLLFIFFWLILICVENRLLIQ